MAEEAPKSGNDVEQNKGLAAISYLWILFLIPILTKKDSAFAMYHAKQGLILFIVTTVTGFVVWIPVIGWLLGILSLILFIIGIMNALNGKMEPLPVIGKWAEKINL